MHSRPAVGRQQLLYNIGFVSNEKNCDGARARALKCVLVTATTKLLTVPKYLRAGLFFQQVMEFVPKQRLKCTLYGAKMFPCGTSLIVMYHKVFISLLNNQTS